jgi:DNA-binding transcriptional LysR family regulator
MAIEWFRRSGVRFRRANFCNSMNAVSLLVRAGQGYSILPTEYYQTYVEMREMRILKTDPPLPTIEYFAMHFQHHVSRLVPTIASIAAEASLFRLPRLQRKQRIREKLAFAELR